MYLSRFVFPDEDREWAFHMGVKRKCYTTFYPFGVLSRKGVTELTFEPVTILYGGNGSGKTTVLNIIAEKLHLERDALYNRSSFYEDYLNLCDFDLRTPVPGHSRVITRIPPTAAP